MDARSLACDPDTMAAGELSSSTFTGLRIRSHREQQQQCWEQQSHLLTCAHSIILMSHRLGAFSSKAWERTMQAGLVDGADDLEGPPGGEDDDDERYCHDHRIDHSGIKNEQRRGPLKNDSS